MMSALTVILIDVQRAFYDPAWGPRNNPEAPDRTRCSIRA